MENPKVGSRLAIGELLFLGNDAPLFVRSSLSALLEEQVGQQAGWFSSAPVSSSSSSSNTRGGSSNSSCKSSAAGRGGGAAEGAGPGSCRRTHSKSSSNRLPAAEEVRSRAGTR